MAKNFMFASRLLPVALILLGLAVPARALEVKSPDGKLTLTFEVKDFESAKNCPVYRVDYQGKPLIVDSRLGLAIKGAPLADGLSIAKETPSSQDTSWKPVYGERESIPDRYNQVVVELKETKSPNRLLQITFRAYDEGVAFCYTIPKQAGMDSVAIARENSEFRFVEDYPAWATNMAQGIYKKVPISKILPGCERPLVIELAENRYVALGEARLVDFARMKFEVLKGAPHSLVSRLDGPVVSALPLTSPWRFIMAAESPGQLLENNFLVLNLNDPCAIKDTSWIKPGKVIRDMSLSTQGGKACVDFAVKHNIQYVDFSLWCGPRWEAETDPTRVDPRRDLDLNAVIQYGKERGIGVILYVDKGLEEKLDVIQPMYHQWGVKGMKYGFVRFGSQEATAWLHQAIRKAADNQLVLDIHDEYRVTGYTRTYPNLMTSEGINGDESKPPMDQTLDIVFTRMIAGSGDTTICYFDKRVDKIWSHAYQLAKAVCIYSPLEYVYWYDRPKDSPRKAVVLSKRPTQANVVDVISEVPELEFFDQAPSVWDEKKVVQGKIGEYAVIARRSGANWFVGCMNANQPRTLDVPLSFLEKGKQYVANIYTDDPAVPTRTHVKIERFMVNNDTVLKAVLSGKNGEAIRIVPAGGNENYPSYR